ncbi:hypothetical protein [Pandoraea anhela]|uniref:hypothetical protein n=1 Tax=Pandoraea anhela TaxID=2508295 RepID=UPI0015825AA4|nr:hypothetical protein [Pandoraea anhela]
MMTIAAIMAMIQLLRRNQDVNRGMGEMAALDGGDWRRTVCIAGEMALSGVRRHISTCITRRQVL